MTPINAWMVRGPRGLAPYWGIAFTKKALVAQIERFPRHDRPMSAWRIVRVVVTVRSDE